MRIAGRCRKDRKNGLWACQRRGEGNSGVHQTEGELGQTGISGVGAARFGTGGAGGQGPKAELPERGRKQGALGALGCILTSLGRLQPELKPTPTPPGWCCSVNVKDESSGGPAL